MKCPFPGMDPYIERPELWPDFHDRLITYIAGSIQPMLRPKYAAVTQDRLYLVEPDRNVYPDVAVVRSPVEDRDLDGGGSVQVAVVTEVVTSDEPVIFPFTADEIREPFIEIIEAAGEKKVVTVIEVLSPANKAPGRGREAYSRKRELYWAGGANIVEIDLLRDGLPLIQLTNRQLDALKPWSYLVNVLRSVRYQHEVYRIPLTGRLPNVRLPLLEPDPDVTLDLQSVFERCWNEGPYPALLRYEGPPPGPLTPQEVRWCEACIAKSNIPNGQSPVT